MAVNDGIAFWNALKVKVKSLIKQDTFNCLRMERYDVTTAPNGTTIGVTMPEGGKEINIPYSKDVANATIGDTVMVGWRGSMSTARAMWFGKGYSGGGVSPLDIYPIGSIYMSVNSADPGTLFGGIWQRIQDTFLLAAGSSYEAGSTGGSASNSHTHTTDSGTTGGTTLTESQIPSHRHLRLYTDSGYWADNPLYVEALYNTTPQAGNLKPVTTDWNATDSNMMHVANIRTGAAGGGSAHSHSQVSVGTSSPSDTNNMPPYLTVYVWKRTA